MKRFFEPLTTAWTSIVTHKLRSFLTILGIVIGIAAVIILMSVGKGAQASILSSLSGLGANMISIRGGSSSSNGVRGASGSSNSLTVEDAKAIAASVSDINGVMPTTSSFAQVIYGSQNMNAQITGITTNYFELYSTNIAQGENISESQYNRNQKVAVIGPTVASTLFEGNDVIGQKIRVNSPQQGTASIYTVIGVLESKGESFISSDQQIFVPLTTLQAGMSRSLTATGNHIVQTITVQAANEKVIASVKQQITLLLEERHKIQAGASDDFTMSSTDEITNAINSSMQTLTYLLGAIAGISLLVGGIGVMNIMLVSVMERRREIGIRKALGAKERDIWGQFLLDSAVLTLAGGVIGVLIGWGGCYLINRTGLVTTVITSDVVILAVAVSVGIGLFFGFYPSWQGSRLDPIQALRSE
jgi:putative ABC transport system permease protein